MEEKLENGSTHLESRGRLVTDMNSYNDKAWPLDVDDDTMYT